MRHFILWALLIQPSLSLAGHPIHPWIRVCMTSGGIYELANDGKKEVALCKLGDAILSASSLVIYKSQFEIPTAIESYLNTSNPDPNFTCASKGARDGSLHNKLHTYNVCTFIDDSFILQDSLQQGPSSESNQSLNRALDLYAGEN
ncbi:hypothetical protein [Bdellovibrio bacteriovorus]|uniref:hypothetical protein n=1 Tax=Bdellovibrio bacteriovorus TaxID=959 RepID=UPI0005A1AC05|nr:hypothetical protein [Bdellovibrio bacteriovorus]